MITEGQITLTHLDKIGIESNIWTKDNLKVVTNKMLVSHVSVHIH